MLFLRRLRDYLFPVIVHALEMSIVGAEKSTAGCRCQGGMGCDHSSFFAHRHDGSFGFVFVISVNERDVGNRVVKKRRFRHDALCGQPCRPAVLKL